VQTLRFYFDPISPYAALAFERLPQVLEGLSCRVDYVPILFAALLKASGAKGPAEIPGKREWTYRQVQWLGHRQGLALELPAAHPFNALPLLRLCWAAAPQGATPSRWVVEQVLRHVWQGGAPGLDPLDPARLQTLHTALAPASEPASEAVKQRLRQATDAAQQAGVFGVPTLEARGKLFWVQEALDMAVACLKGDPWFDGPAWDAAAQLAPAQDLKRPI